MKTLSVSAAIGEEVAPTASPDSIEPAWSPWSPHAYEAACLEHAVAIAAGLARLDGRIEGALNREEERAHLGTMRLVLESGLFDADFYLKKYDDVRMAEVDPLDHYVRHGDAEGRTPNFAFLPKYYRRHSMGDAPAGANALAHYIETGEHSGSRPNPAFDPQTYLREYPGLADFVTRPLFHYLRIGMAAGYRIRGVPLPVILAASEYRERALTDGSEDHLLLMEAKRAAVAACGVKGGFLVYRQLIGRRDHAEICLKRLTSLAEYCRRHAAVFRETVPAGDRVVVPSPPVIGDGSRPPLDGSTRSMFVACLIDARVRSRSNLIEVADAALLDYEGEELDRIDDQIDFDPGIFHRAGEAAWIAAPIKGADAVEIEEAFSLLGIYSHAFGHWMIEFLPKYIAARLSGALPRVPVLIDQGMPATFRQALELLLGDEIEIVELPPFSTARVRRLWCAPTLGHFPVCQTYSERFKWDYFITPPSRFLRVIREMHRLIDRATAEPSGVERIYLAREPHQHNKLINHEAIEAAAEARGFRVLYAHRLDFVEQARLVRHARFVIGPDGSQMFLSVFARPGTKICLLSNDQPENIGEIQAEHAALYGEYGLDYTVMTGPTARLRLEYPWQSNYRIDEQGFCRFLDQWLEAERGSAGVCGGAAEDPADPGAHRATAWSKEAYDSACAAHAAAVAPAVRRLEARIEAAENGALNPDALSSLRTMREVLESGLFDADFYLQSYQDLRIAGVDPLEHYVRHGDREGRMPNPAFLPGYYRQHHMEDAPPAANALVHYITIGERSGGRPNKAFDPRTYLAEHPELADFVTRPLFHFLRIGIAAGYRVWGVPLSSLMPALTYQEELEIRGVEGHSWLMDAKRAIVEDYGVEEGFAVYRQLIGRSDHAEIHLRQLSSLVEYCRRHGAFFRETAPAGERVVVPAPRVVGDGDHPPLSGRTRTMFVGCLSDARVRSLSRVIEAGDVALLDYEGDELARIDDYLDYDPAIFHVAGEEAWILAPAEGADTIEIAEAFTLLGVNSWAFGHWMIEFLPKYIAALLSGALPRVPVLIDQDMPKTFRQVLELMFADRVEIIELPSFSTARVRRLWCAPTLGYFPVWLRYNERLKWDYFVMPPTRFIPVIQEMNRLLDRATAEPTGIDRVYLAREAHQHNKMMNHAAIEAEAEMRGFRVVYAHRLDFAEQVRLLRHARFVLGPDGSQMFLAFFARPGAKVFILSNDNPNNIGEMQAEYGFLYGDYGLDYTVMTGPCVGLWPEAPWASDYEIDEGEFCRLLDRWLDT